MPISKWHYLSPYLPSVADISPLDATIYSMLPNKANWDRQERWRKPCMPMQDPDETTSLTYSSDNNLTHVDLTNGNDVDFKYDAAGRRVEKTFTTYVTSGTTTTTTVTTYKYHYIGSQITTIEIDQTQTVDDGGEGDPVTTTTKDDEIRIHLGANSRPISFEYYTENQNTQQTTSATYYYHYDLHGNVIRVTNSSGTTVIQYTYDQLGSIVSETNPNSIYNPFTYMGEAQIIHDDEFDTSGSTPKTGLFNSGSGYYNPKTGTFLGGSGAPASANPTSTSAEEPTAQASNPSDQSYGTAMSSAKDGGAPTDSNKASATAGSSEDVAPQNAYQGVDEGGAQTLPGYNPNELSYMPVILMSIEFIMPGGDDEVPIPQPPIKIPGSESFYIIPPPSPGGNNPTESVGRTQATYTGPMSPPDCSVMDEFELKKMLQKKWYEEHKYLFENQELNLGSDEGSESGSSGLDSSSSGGGNVGGGEIKPCWLGFVTGIAAIIGWMITWSINKNDIKNTITAIVNIDPRLKALRNYGEIDKLADYLITELAILCIDLLSHFKWEVGTLISGISTYLAIVKRAYVLWALERIAQGKSYSHTDFLADKNAMKDLEKKLREEGFLIIGTGFIMVKGKDFKEVLGRGNDNQIQPAPVRVLPALQY